MADFALEINIWLIIWLCILFVCLFICLFVCLLACLFVCLYHCINCNQLFCFLYVYSINYERLMEIIFKREKVF